MKLQQVFRAVILFVFAVFLIQLHRSGDVFKLINPAYVTLSKIAGILFLILFVAQLYQIFVPNSHHYNHQHHHHEASRFKGFISYFLIILPLFIGITMPFSTLDASIAQKKGMMVSLESSGAGQAQAMQQQSQKNSTIVSDPNPPDPDLYSNKMNKQQYDSLMDQLPNLPSVELNEQMYTAYYQAIHNNPELYAGKEIKLTGFVYREEGFSTNQFVLGRFVITHCVADASIVGFLANLEGAEKFAEDTWMEVTGAIYLENYQGNILPAIKITDGHTITEPQQPYLYPVSMKIR
ncbi:TIGR03943 family putative permease subunit [Paraliobacillus ryukyuensis]|uniref:TIGR03943 family putative permease subunit n=1 Tax=Paraliobacillus ryukyuensis TaxID=200904 RepID=UPI0009A607B9|nr:TIGR03943 family protein [Paraliobacillus ryukyuensis]